MWLNKERFKLYEEVPNDGTFGNYWINSKLYRKRIQKVTINSKEAIINYN